MTPRTRPPARVGLLRRRSRSIVTSGSRVTSSSPPSRFDGVAIGAFLPTGRRPRGGHPPRRASTVRPTIRLMPSSRRRAPALRRVPTGLRAVRLGPGRSRGPGGRRTSPWRSSALVLVVIVASVVATIGANLDAALAEPAGDVPRVLRSAVAGAVLDPGRVGARAARRGRRTAPARAASRPARRASPSRWSSPSLARRSSSDDDPWSCRAAVRRRQRSARLPARRADDLHGGDLDRVASRQPRRSATSVAGSSGCSCSARCSSGPRRRPVASPPSPSACSPPPPSTWPSARRAAARRRRASGWRWKASGSASTSSPRRRCTPRGRCSSTAPTRDGPLSVKVYGRDAWDGQLLANVWRLAWYRDTQRTVRLSRLELVEHEGFVTLLAERAGVRVPRLVTAGSAGRGDALVVVRPDGVPLRGLDGNGRRRGDRRAVARPRPPPRRRDRPRPRRPRPARRPRRRDDRLRRPVVGHRSPPTGPTCCRTTPRSCACPCCSSARIGPRPRRGGRSATTGCCPCCRTCRRRRCRRGCAPRSADRTSSSTTCAAGCGRCSARRSSR